MSALNTEALLLGQEGGGGGYAISRSLRFNSSDSAYCSRVFSSAGDRKKWCYSAWVKRAALGASQWLFAVEQASTQQRFGISSSDKLTWVFQQGECAVTTTAVFRDPSAYYHIVLVSDTDNADQTLRIRIFVNGVAQATGIEGFAARWPTSGEQWAINNNITHNIGRFTDTSNPASYSNLYLAETLFLDGVIPGTITRTVNGVIETILTDFGEFDATTGVWVPNAYTGTYGTNGFHLEFADNSSNTAATLGKDTSPNGNNWTPNNLSVTAGAGNDSLVDVPVNGAQTDTGAGGEVRGNYCTWNPLNRSTSYTYSNGNLDFAYDAAQDGHASTTVAVTSGSWYCEVTLTARGSDTGGVCVLDGSKQWTNTNVGTSGQIEYRASGQIIFGGAVIATVAAYFVSDVIGISIDATNNQVKFYKNNTLQHTQSGLVFSSYMPGFYANGGAGRTMGAALNTGQRAFAYTAPSGFKALNTANLPAPTITQPSTVMDVKLYTGNGSTQTISGLEFSPDFVWLKRRSATGSHRLFDTIRGATKELYSDATEAEGTDATNLTAFNSDGFSLGSGVANSSSTTYVAWTWDAGSSTVTNTVGSISSQVRANASAGFSIVTYTGTGANATVGHGLGVSPALIFLKSRGGARNWVVYSSSLASAAYYLSLNQTIAQAQLSTVWNSTAPTSTVFSIGTDAAVNNSSENYVAYCFAPVSGYSSFGSYTGNGSADGPFVYTGFRPRWVMTKRTDSAEIWFVYDSARNTYNPLNLYLEPHTSAGEQTYSSAYDYLSNGFKIRNTAGSYNASGGTYVYFAFAESPFAANNRAR